MAVTTTNSATTSNTSVSYYTANNSATFYIKQQPIGFTVTGMRPNTRLSVFFDKINVTALCSPATYPSSIKTPTSKDYLATANVGSAITTDSTGTATGIFYVPKGFFVVGNKEIAFFNYGTDSDDYAERDSNHTCVSKSIFYSFNHSLVSATKNSIFSTRPFQSASSNTTTNRGTGTPTSADPNNPRFDPMCQSFYVGSDMTKGQDGIFLKSVDIYFSAKSNTQPVSIDIRTMENGIPTTTVLPFSKVTVPASSVTTSTDATAATTFVFDTPVYVRSGYDYAISVIPGGQSPDYAVWTAIVGKTDPNNGAVNANWGQGVLFTSSTGSTWTPIQNQYMKFNVYRADFANYSLGGQVTLTNDDYEFLTISNIDETGFRVGEYVYQHPNPLPGFVSVNTTSNTLTVNTAASGNNVANLAATFAVNDHICVIGSIVNNKKIQRVFANAITLRVTSANATAIQFSFANGSPANGASFTNSAAHFFKLAPGTISMVASNNKVVGTGTRFDTLANTRPIIAVTCNNTSHAHNILFPSVASNSTTMTLKNAPFVTNSTAFPIDAPVGRIIDIDYDRNLMILDRSTANNVSAPDAWTNAYATPSYFAMGRTIIGTTSGSASVIQGVNDISINSAQPYIYQTVVQGSDVQYDANTINNGYSPVAYPKLPISDTIYFSNDHIVVASKSNEIVNNSGEKSLKVYANLVSSSPLLTPLIDADHISLITKENIINDSADGEETNTGSSLSKSVSKIVTLADGLDAEDLNVYLTAYKPQNTNIKVFAKLLNAADPDSFENKTWSELVQVTDYTLTSDSTNLQDYKEFQYTLPTDPITYDIPDDLITTNNSVTLTSTLANSTWTEQYSNNQQIVVWSDSNKTKYEVHTISSVNSNTQLTLANPIGFTNTTSAFIGTMPFPYSAYKNSMNSNIVRYHDQNGVPYDSYKQYAIKIVLSAKQNNLVPKVADMRAIALSV